MSAEKGTLARQTTVSIRENSNLSTEEFPFLIDYFKMNHQSEVNNLNIKIRLRYENGISLTVADILLVPFVPRSFDVWTIEKVSKLVSEMKTVNPELRACMFLNRADPRGQDNYDTAEVLKENHALTFLDTPLGARKAFSNAAAEGLGVSELKPQDPKAVAEISKLYSYIFDIR